MIQPDYKHTKRFHTETTINKQPEQCNTSRSTTKPRTTTTFFFLSFFNSSLLKFNPLYQFTTTTLLPQNKISQIINIPLLLLLLLTTMTVMLSILRFTRRFKNNKQLFIDEIIIAWNWPKNLDKPKLALWFDSNFCRI